MVRIATPMSNMAKVLQLSRPNRRVRNIVRAWLAIRQQRRRRHSGYGTPEAPIVVDAAFEQSTGEPLYWYDVIVVFTFEQGRFPDGTLEVYWARQSQGWVSNYVGSVSSTVRSYRHVRAFSDFESDRVRYTMRYRSGTEIIGPFGPAYQFVYVAP